MFDISSLDGGFNPFEKCWSNWIISPGRDENKKYLKPPPSSPQKRKSFNHCVPSKIFWSYSHRYTFIHPNVSYIKQIMAPPPEILLWQPTTWTHNICFLGLTETQATQETQLHCALRINKTSWERMPTKIILKHTLRLYPHLPVPHIFGTRGLVAWYIGFPDSLGNQMYV